MSISKPRPARVYESLTYLQGLHFKVCYFDITPYRTYVSDYDLPSNYTTVWVNDSSKRVKKLFSVNQLDLDNYFANGYVRLSTYVGPLLIEGVN